MSYVDREFLKLRLEENWWIGSPKILHDFLSMMAAFNFYDSHSSKIQSRQNEQPITSIQQKRKERESNTDGKVY